MPLLRGTAQEGTAQEGRLVGHLAAGADGPGWRAGTEERGVQEPALQDWNG